MSASASYAAKVRRTRWAFLILVIAALELYGRFFADPAFMQPPSAVVRAWFTTILPDGRIMAALGASILEIAAAYALAVVIGLLIGLAIGSTQLGRKGFFPMVMLLYAIPQVALISLFILLFGLGPASKIAFGFSHGVFPIIINVVGGMANAPTLYIRGAKSMGASRYDIVRHVIFPNMVPSFFVGLRLAMTLTLLGVILAELYVSTGGIGYFTRVFAENFNPAPLFALIVSLAVIALVFNECVRLAERRLSRSRLAIQP